jgi:hypothetical protein
MNMYVPITENVTPDWLTAVLRDAGHLPRGAVSYVKSSDSSAFNSSTVFLTVEYSDNAPPDAPKNLVLKRNADSAWSREAGVYEAQFYDRVRQLPKPCPAIVPCYASFYDATTQDSYILLEALPPSYAPPVTRDNLISLSSNVPFPHQIQNVVEALAALHAYWWEHPLSQTREIEVGYWLRDADQFAKYYERRHNAWNALLEAEKDWLPASVATLYKQFFAKLPIFWERYLKPRYEAKTNLTLMHGDAYFSNFMCLKGYGRDNNAYLLDWQTYSFDIGASDLVNLLATFWTREQRRTNNREQTALRWYHTTLQTRVMPYYSWEDLQDDYRAGLIYWLLMPVQDRANGSHKNYWWPKMQCLIAAFEDWNCEHFLTSGL